MRYQRCRIDRRPDDPPWNSGVAITLSAARTDAMKEFDMKIHSATTATGSRHAIQPVLPSKENLLLAAGVALAFAFVTACIFTLG